MDASEEEEVDEEDEDQLRRHKKANVLTEIPTPWLPPWQSKVTHSPIYVSLGYVCFELLKHSGVNLV